MSDSYLWTRRGISGMEGTQPGRQRPRPRSHRPTAKFFADIDMGTHPYPRPPPHCRPPPTHTHNSQVSRMHLDLSTCEVG
jgi:hypothetical protein